MPAEMPAQGEPGRKRAHAAGGPPVAPATGREPRIAEVIAGQIGLEGPLLPIFHAIQAEFGFVPREALPMIAEALNLSRAEVHGVFTFYHDFRDHPQGRHVLRLCRAEACQSMGADALAERVKRLTGLGWHETARDGSLTLEPVFCLGLCACGPSAQWDGEVIGRVDEAVVAELLEGAR